MDVGRFKFNELRTLSLEFTLILTIIYLVCDSIHTLNLTINNSSTSSSTVTACDSFDWNGQTYTSSGSYTWTGTNSVGCDSA